MIWAGKLLLGQKGDAKAAESLSRSLILVARLDGNEPLLLHGLEAALLNRKTADENTNAMQMTHMILHMSPFCLRS